MKKKLYVVTLELQDNLYTDYIMKARTKFWAKHKVKKYYFKQHPGANKNIKLHVDAIIPMKEETQWMMKFTSLDMIYRDV